ncbi:MAG: STAS domain-containing protein [Proteobacteria bacterium]|nr:STAS domain-containing protein [Pseudomonadota bacterium]MBU1612208.1 STAS domain-containing protein [Pseudomonadota bacterium]
MKLTIIEQNDEVTHVALSGRLDVEGVEAVGREFDAAVGAQGVSAVVDLSGITFLASMGLGLLLRNSTILGKSGARLVVLGPVTLVEEVLRIAGLDQITPVARDMNEAMALVRR